MLLALGTLGFWIFLAAAAIILTILVNYELPGWSLIFIGAFFVALRFLSGFNLAWQIKNNLGLFGLFLVLYFVTGALWSVGKWWFFVGEFRDSYRALRDGFMEKHQLDPKGDIPESLKHEWADHYSGYGRANVQKPLIRENKSRLTTWILYWPFSAVWTLINDPVRKVANWIYKRLQFAYQSIADHQFKGTEKDLELIKKVAAEKDEQTKKERAEYEARRQEEYEARNRNGRLPTLGQPRL